MRDVLSSRTIVWRCGSEQMAPRYGTGLWAIEAFLLSWHFPHSFNVEARPTFGSRHLNHPTLRLRKGGTTHALSEKLRQHLQPFQSASFERCKPVIVDALYLLTNCCDHILDAAETIFRDNSSGKELAFAGAESIGGREIVDICTSKTGDNMNKQTNAFWSYGHPFFSETHLKKSEPASGTGDNCQPTIFNMTGGDDPSNGDTQQEETWETMKSALKILDEYKSLMALPELSEAQEQRLSLLLELAAHDEVLDRWFEKSDQELESADDDGAVAE